MNLVGLRTYWTVTLYAFLTTRHAGRTDGERTDVLENYLIQNCHCHHQSCSFLLFLNFSLDESGSFWRLAQHYSCFETKDYKQEQTFWRSFKNQAWVSSYAYFFTAIFTSGQKTSRPFLQLHTIPLLETNCFESESMMHDAATNLTSRCCGIFCQTWFSCYINGIIWSLTGGVW
jgi:hypothetical protein